MPTLHPPEYPARPDAPLLGFGPSFSEEIARSVIAAVYSDDLDSPHEDGVRVAASLTMLEAFHPRDHLECMLAAQGVAMHAAIMDDLAKAMNRRNAPALAIKYRANAASLSRTFSGVLRDLERRQSQPSPPRPDAPPPGPPPEPRRPAAAAPPPPGDEAPASDAGETLATAAAETRATTAAKPRRARARPAPAPPAALGPSTTPAPPGVPAPLPHGPPEPCPVPAPPTPHPVPTPPAHPAPGPPLSLALALDEMSDIPDDIETRPDGTPGSLAAYAPKPPNEVYIPREAPEMIALASRPKPWRQVNVPPDQHPRSPLDQAPVTPDSSDPGQAPRRGPLDLTENIYGGDALSRFVSGRSDPGTRSPLFDDTEDSIVELEVLSTGGDPESEAYKAALMAAHPEGKPISVIRLGSGAPASIPPAPEPEEE